MKEVILDCGQLMVEFFLGSCALSYKGTYLSKQLGLYSSIYYQHKWYDSTYAQWQIIENKKNKKILYGRWANISHRQRWILESFPDGLRWAIECENLDTFCPDMIQQNYMLSDLYTRWKVEKYAQGKFPEFFANYKGLLWDRMWSMPQTEKTKVFLQGTEKEINIPSISWEPLSSRDDTIMVIENSDPRYSARVLQLLFVSRDEKELNEYPVILRSEIKVSDEIN